MKKVVHLTSVHSRSDTRIFFKECRSLVENGYQVDLIVADGKGSGYDNSIYIYDVGLPNNRLDRMIYTVKKIFEQAIDLNAEIYHLHDPELLWIALKLKKRGKKVIFDAHEDFPKQILSKPYLSKFARFILSKFFSWYEKYVCAQLDVVVGATPYICNKFLNMEIKSIDINNYPLLSEFDVESVDWSSKKNKICYIGGLTKVRGVLEMVKATELTKNSIKLQIAGQFLDPMLEHEVCQLSGWNNVDYLGWLNRENVQLTIESSIAGLVILHPIVNYNYSLPVKMFEYMAMGIPVIASNISLWEEIVEREQSGICVDPFNISEIAQAIDYLINNPEEAESMGRNGKKAIREKYNWFIEEKKLISLYEELVTL